MKPCAQLWKADALEDGALAPGDVDAFLRHGRGCADCRDRVRRGRELAVATRRLEARPAPELLLRRLRERVLRDAHARATASEGVAGWRAALAAGLALALVSAVWLLVKAGRPRAETAFAGSVAALPGATWSRAREAGVETLSLGEGEFWIAVRKQTAEERFKVKVPNGEIEVRGTTFRVAVDARGAREVGVLEGHVAVRIDGEPPRELVPGQTWSIAGGSLAGGPVAAEREAAQAPTPPARVAAQAPPVARRTLAPGRTHAVEAGGEEGLAYEATMGLYRSGRYADAAEAFRSFASRYPSSALVEDATFLEALSLTRAGRLDAGAVAASRHLAQFPRSFHGKDAAILVARAARDRGDCAEARRVLDPWLGAGRDAAVVDAMGGCL